MIELRVTIDGDKHDVQLLGDATDTELYTLLGILTKIECDVRKEVSRGE